MGNSFTDTKIRNLEDEIEELDEKVKSLQKQVDTNEASLRQMAADLAGLKKRVR